MRFCGRAEEMAQIIERWQRASKVEAPEPQLVILKAERGVGKTRLALEFYRWLSETIDGVGRESYWPDAVAVLDSSIDVNPDPDSCRYDVPIPYLWWGLRASDKGAENGIAGDAIATHDKFLAPHLVALTMRARMMSSGKSIVNVWRDVAKGEAASWSGYDTVISVGEGLLKTVGILRGTLGSSANSAREEVGKRSKSRVDAVMVDLESIFNPRSYTYAKTPGVILIDDAQFSTDDPGLSVFAERLLHSAMTQSWPVLILVTHWKRDLAPEFMKTERCFAGILHHGRDRTPADNGPAAGLPGGFLKTRNTLEIDLPIVPDLSGALAEALPGLSPDQASALLNHAGGNPRHLEQIIAFLRENEDFFEDFDTQAALTEEGLAEALKETHDIFKVVMRRLRDAPQDVQEAICLASLHGVRFVFQTVDEHARLHLGETRGEALVKAVNPYSMVSSRRREKIAEFSERLFYMVAERRRRSLKSLADEDALRTSLKAALRTRLENGGVATDVEEQVLICGLAAQAFSEEHPEDRHHLLLALALLAHAEAGRYSYEAAVEAASRFYAVFQWEPNATEDLHGSVLAACASLLRAEGRAAEALEILDPLLARRRDLAERLKTPESLRDLSVSLDNVGGAAQVAGDHAAAAKAYAESLEVARDLAERLKTPESLRDLSVSLNNVGGAAQVAGDHAAAAKAYAESLEMRRDLAERLKTPESLRDLSVSLNNVGGAAQVAGDHAAAAKAYAESLEVARDLAERLKTPESLRDLSVSLNNVGGAAQVAGDHAAAAKAYAESLEVARDLAERLKTPESLRDLSVSLDKVSGAAQVAGDHAAAAEAYAESLEVARDLAERLKTPESLRDLSVSLDNVGDAAQVAGDHAAAAKAYAESLEVRRDLAERLKTPESLRDLSVSLNNVGGAAQVAGDHAAAAKAYAESLEVRRDLAERLKTPESLRDLSVSLDNVGGAAQVAGDHAAAAKAYGESLEVRRDLAERLKTPESLRDLSVSLDNVGGAAQVAGDHAAAAKAYGESLEVRRDLAERLKAPGSLRDLSVSLDKVGGAAQVAGDHAAAAKAYGESLEVRRDLAERLKTPESLRDLSVSLNNVGGAAQVAGDHAAAAKAYAESLEVARDLAERLKTPGSLRDLSVSLNNVGGAAQVAGDHAAATKAYGESLEVARDLVERLKTPESLRDLCVALYLNSSLHIKMARLDEAAVFVDEGETLATSIPEFMRDEVVSAFQGLRTLLDQS